MAKEEIDQYPLSISDWIVILQNIISTTRDIYIFFGYAIISAIAILIAMHQIVKIDNPPLNIILLTSILYFFYILMNKKNEKYNEPFKKLYDDIIYGKETNPKEILQRYEKIEMEIKKKEKRRENMQYRILKYLIGIFGLAFIISGIVIYFLEGTDWWSDNQLGLAFIPIGISVISIAIAIHSVILSKQSNEIAVGSKIIAEDSDKKMTALTNSEFYEKITMFDKYKNAIENLKKNIKEKETIQIKTEGFKDDLEAVSQLMRYLDDKQKKRVIEEYIVPILESIKNVDIDQKLINKIKELQRKFESS